jgi:hypothetical protein
MSRSTILATVKNGVKTKYKLQLIMVPVRHFEFFSFTALSPYYPNAPKLKIHVGNRVEELSIISNLCLRLFCKKD